MSMSAKSPRSRGKIRAERAAGLAAGIISFTLSSVSSAGEECQNQIEIDVCKAGCTATSEVCGALCDFTSGACWVGCQAVFGTCEVGCDACDVGCTTTCCPLPDFVCDCGDCRDDCDDCHRGCRNEREDCRDDCRLDCDECIFNCEQDCESICRPFKKIGESCIPLFDRCADGLVCWPFPLPGQDGLQCFPSDNEEEFDDDACRDQYSSLLHGTVLGGGSTVNFGRGGSLAAAIGATFESGTVYGPGGRFGCYESLCFGATTDVEIGEYASIGSFISYDAFHGQSIMLVEEAGQIGVFSAAQFLSTDGAFLGLADSLALEISLLPVSVGAYDCATIVNTVWLRNPDGSLSPVTNSAPEAICTDVEACADAVSCVADVSIDHGSADPDGDPLAVELIPPAPYALGEHNVTLTVTDPAGASDSCSRHVTVNDCDPPQIICPLPITVDCEGDGGAFLNPGAATVADCSETMIIEPGEQFFPVGATPAVYMATDVAGNEATCETLVTVVDAVPPIVMELSPVPDVLWPPNDRMRQVTIDAVVVDECEPTPQCVVIDVGSDESQTPIQSNAPVDFEITDGGAAVMLRAERDAHGDGRVYTLTVECRDGSGNTAVAMTFVTVPHDRRDAMNATKRLGSRPGR